ncbi:hypothetical protein TNCV_545561 [Trichonephila clavipes]|nr:hypothetical protein TNCV_545561 [Trichonephila clavipes]
MGCMLTIKPLQTWQVLKCEIHFIVAPSSGGSCYQILTLELMYATRGLLATDLVILNHGQVTRMTPELAPTSPNSHTTPAGGRLSPDRFNVYQPVYTAGLQGL